MKKPENLLCGTNFFWGGKLRAKNPKPESFGHFGVRFPLQTPPFRWEVPTPRVMVAMQLARFSDAFSGFRVSVFHHVLSAWARGTVQIIGLEKRHNNQLGFAYNMLGKKNNTFSKMLVNFDFPL